MRSQARGLRCHESLGGNCWPDEGEDASSRSVFLIAGLTHYQLTALGKKAWLGELTAAGHREASSLSFEIIKLNIGFIGTYSVLGYVLGLGPSSTGRAVIFDLWIKRHLINTFPNTPPQIYKSY